MSRQGFPAARPDTGPGDGLARWLIRHAARNAPASLSQRLEEEWLADLAGRPTQGAARLRLALGCCWATRVIAHEFAAAAATAGGSATGDKTMTLYAQHDSSFFSRRTTVILVIAAVHLMLIYGVASGIVYPAVVIPPVTQVSFAPEPHTPNLPPPPPRPPDLTPQHVDIPDADFRVDTPGGSDAIRVVAPEAGAYLLPAPQPLNRVPGGPGKGFPDTEDFYPAAAKRLGESGVVSVRVCVDGTGRLTAQPALAQSSGSARLDEGALRLAKAGSGHYRATTEDGRPVSSCYPFRIRFELRN